MYNIGIKAKEEELMSDKQNISKGKIEGKRKVSGKHIYNAISMHAVAPEEDYEKIRDILASKNSKSGPTITDQQAEREKDKGEKDE